MGGTEVLLQLILGGMGARREHLWFTIPSVQTHGAPWMRLSEQLAKCLSIQRALLWRTRSMHHTSEGCPELWSD